MERKAFLIAFLLISILAFASVRALLTFTSAFTTQNNLIDAGPDQTVYVSQEVMFSGVVFVSHDLIISIEWDFDDGNPPVNSSDPAILTTTHTYTVAAVYNVTLSVKLGSGYNRTETDTVRIVVRENLPPVADAGPDQIVEATSPAGAEVTLNASSSYDPYGDPLTYEWTWAGASATEVSLTETFPIGTTTVTLTVSDGQYTDTDTINIIVQDTTPPTVNAGDDIMVEQASYEGTEVTLHGNATDIADIELDYLWTKNGITLGNKANLTYTFNLGTHVLILSAIDDSGNMGNDSVVITVVDTVPPDMTVSVTLDILWPPNHKYVEIKATVTTHDICDPSPTITLVSITSNEPDNANGMGDGDTVNDIVIIDDFTFKLRAERAGTGSGRIYTITYQATDNSGNTVTVSVTVIVPHEK